MDENPILKYKNKLKQNFSNECISTHGWKIVKMKNMMTVSTKKAPNNTLIIKIVFSIDNTNLEKIYSTIMDPIRFKEWNNACLEYRILSKINNYGDVFYLANEYPYLCDPRYAVFARFWDIEKDNIWVYQKSFDMKNFKPNPKFKKENIPISGFHAKTILNGVMITFLTEINIVEVNMVESITSLFKKDFPLKAYYDIMKKFKYCIKEYTNQNKNGKVPMFRNIKEIYEDCPEIKLNEIEEILKEDICVDKNRSSFFI